MSVWFITMKLTEWESFIIPTISDGLRKRDWTGWDYKTIEDDNIIIPVLSVSAEYKTMSRYGDNVVIYVKLAEYTGIRIGFSYEVHDKKTGELRCVGTSCHCLLDEKNKPVFMRKRYPEKDAFFKELMKQQAEENA